MSDRDGTAPSGVRARRVTSAARERDGLRALLMSIGHETELVPLLQRVLDEACARVAADYGLIALLTDAREGARVTVARGLPRDLVGRELASGVGLTGEVLRTRAPVRLRRDADARRFALERRRADRLTLLAHVGRLVTADLQLDDPLQRAADGIHELPGYENVAIALLAAGDTPEAPDVLDLRHAPTALTHAHATHVTRRPRP